MVGLARSWAVGACAQRHHRQCRRARRNRNADARRSGARCHATQEAADRTLRSRRGSRGAHVIFAQPGRGGHHRPANRDLRRQLYLEHDPESGNRFSETIGRPKCRTGDFMSVRILEVREITKPISSPIRNAYIDFTKMTTSLVAVVTDVVRDGKPGRRLRLQLQRPLRPGRADPRALRRPHSRSRSCEPAGRCGRQPRSAPDLGRDDEQREAGRPRRTVGRRRHHRHGGVGRDRQDRGQAAVSLAGRAARRRRPTRESSSMRRAATTIRARTTTRCAPRCAAISIAATPS